jgi:hypothetical protein
VSCPWDFSSKSECLQALCNDQRRGCHVSDAVSSYFSEGTYASPFLISETYMNYSRDLCLVWFLIQRLSRRWGLMPVLWFEQLINTSVVRTHKRKERPLLYSWKRHHWMAKVWVLICFAGNHC